MRQALDGPPLQPLHGVIAFALTSQEHQDEIRLYRQGRFVTPFRLLCIRVGRFLSPNRRRRQLTINMAVLSIPWTGTVYLGLIWVLYRVAIALYNISPYHPLAQFPGPKIAASSYLYEAYYDWWCVGRYGKVIARMHELYGMLFSASSDDLRLYRL